MSPKPTKEKTSNETITSIRHMGNHTWSCHCYHNHTGNRQLLPSLRRRHTHSLPTASRSPKSNHLRYLRRSDTYRNSHLRIHASTRNNGIQKNKDGSKLTLLPKEQRNVRQLSSNSITKIQNRNMFFI